MSEDRLIQLGVAGAALFVVLVLIRFAMKLFARTHESTMRMLVESLTSPLQAMAASQVRIEVGIGRLLDARSAPTVQLGNAPTPPAGTVQQLGECTECGTWSDARCHDCYLAGAVAFVCTRSECRDRHDEKCGHASPSISFRPTSPHATQKGH